MDAVGASTFGVGGGTTVGVEVHPKLNKPAMAGIVKNLCVIVRPNRMAQRAIVQHRSVWPSDWPSVSDLFIDGAAGSKGPTANQALGLLKG
jgi:hypothetical protein